MDFRKQAELNNDLFRAKPKHPHKSLRFEVSLPPSVNAIYTLKKGLTAKAQRYIRDTRALINLACDEQFWQCSLPPHWLYVDLVFHMPDRKIRDSHNCLKILMDAMQGIVFENDYFAMPRIQAVEYDKDNPRVVCVITHQRQEQRDMSLKHVHI